MHKTSVSYLVIAQWARALHISIRQKSKIIFFCASAISSCSHIGCHLINDYRNKNNIPLALFTKELGHDIFRGVTISMDLVEDILGNLGLLRGAGTAKVVKGEVEPLVHLCMDSAVLVTQSLARDTLFQSFGFCRSAIFVCTANQQGVVAPSTAVSKEG